MATVTPRQAQAAVKQIKEHHVVTNIRERALLLVKDFKLSWLQIGQTLHAIEEDKLYHAWGYDKLQNYTEKELGLDVQTARKLIKAYLYLIDEVPQCLQDDYKDTQSASRIPSLEAINLLCGAHVKKDLSFEDKEHLKKQVLEKGKAGGELKRDIASLMRERKTADPVAEQEKRKRQLIRTLIRTLTNFHADMETQKLVPYEIVKEAENLLNRLKEQDID
jgi:hypothetical protein